MLFSILQEITSTHEIVEYSEECTQGSLPSCTETVNEYYIEERFEIYLATGVQESRTKFESF